MRSENVGKTVSASSLKGTKQVILNVVGTPQQHYYEFDSSSSIDEVKINTSSRYVEVFVNDRFVFRQISDRIRSVNEIVRFIQPKSETGNQRIRISNIRVQPWEAPQVPFRMTKERALAFHRAKFNSDANDSFAAFELGQALHRLEFYDQAYDAYQHAIKLGQRKADVGFFVGDLLERKGDWSAAKTWYEIAAAKKDSVFYKLSARGELDSYSSPQHWAAFRLAWRRVSFPEEKAEQPIGNQFVLPMAPENTAWMNALLEAQGLATDGKFEEAGKVARTALRHRSPKEEEMIIKIISCYEKQQRFRQPKSETPIYLTVEDSIPFLRQLTDHLSFQSAKEIVEDPDNDRFWRFR
jgi:hypothetical protein